MGVGEREDFKRSINTLAIFHAQTPEDKSMVFLLQSEKRSSNHGSLESLALIYRHGKSTTRVYGLMFSLYVTHHINILKNLFTF